MKPSKEKMESVAPEMYEALKQVNAVIDYLEDEGLLNPDFAIDLKNVTNKPLNKIEK